MTLQVRVVSPTGVEWEGEANGVRLPALEGQMGIRTGHQPVLAVVATGVVHIEPISGSPVDVPVGDGFASVDEDVVTVVVADEPMEGWLDAEARGGRVGSTSAEER